MNVFSFSESTRTEFPGIDLLVDGKIVGQEHPVDAGIPCNYFHGPDLPSVLLDGSKPVPDHGHRLIAVCGCGISGCGGCSAQFIREEQTVRMLYKKVERPPKPSFLRAIFGRPLSTPLPLKVDNVVFTFDRAAFEATLREIWAVVQRQQAELEIKIREHPEEFF